MECGEAGFSLRAISGPPWPTFGSVLRLCLLFTSAGYQRYSRSAARSWPVWGSHKRDLYLPPSAAFASRFSSRSKMAPAISASGSKPSSGRTAQLRSWMASSNDTESPCAKVSRTRLASCVLAESIQRFYNPLSARVYRQTVLRRPPQSRNTHLSSRGRGCAFLKRTTPIPIFRPVRSLFAGLARTLRWRL
jgi:hypothetical protein